MTWAVERWSGAEWVAWDEAVLKVVKEELNGHEDCIILLPNTSSNRSLITSDVDVRLKWNGTIIFTGILTGAQYSEDILECKVYNKVYQKMDKKVFTKTYDQIAADTILGEICTTAGVTAGSCPTDAVSVRFNKTLCLEAAKFLAKALNKDFWSSDDTFNIGDRGTSVGSITIIGVSRRGIDRAKKRDKVYVRGVDKDGNAIEGSAGTGTNEISFTEKKASDQTTLNNIAASYLAELNKDSSGVKVTTDIETGHDIYPGDTVNITRDDLNLSGTFTVWKTTKKVGTVELDVDRLENILEKQLEKTEKLEDYGIYPIADEQVAFDIPASVEYGPIASRPVCNADREGQEYWATDEGIKYLCQLNGTYAWKKIGVFPVDIEDVTPSSPSTPTLSSANITVNTKVLDDGQTITWFTVTWTRVTNASDYVLSYRKTGTTDYRHKVVEQPLSGDPSVDTEWVELNTLYYFKACSRNEFGEVSAWSSEVSKTSGQDTTAPSTPTGLSATGIMGGIFIEWNKNSEKDVSYYGVYISDTTTPPASPSYTTKATVYFHKTTDYGTTKYIWLSAFDRSGNESTKTAYVTASALTVNVADIATSAVTEAKLADGAVATAKLADLAVSTAKLDNLAISADKIATDAVVTDKIADLAVSEAKIGSGAVVASKIGSEEMPCPNLVGDPSYEEWNWTEKVTGHVNDTQSTDYSKFGSYSSKLVASGANASARDSNYINIKGMKKITIATYTKITASTVGNLYINVYFWDANKTLCSPTNHADLWSGSAVHDWTQRSHTYTPSTDFPSDCVYITLSYQWWNASGNPDGTAYVDGWLAVYGEYLPLYIEDVIVAEKIAANAITADKIAGGAVVADKIGAGAVIAEKIASGAVVSDKIAANAVVADKIASDAVISDKIYAGAVTTTKLDSSAVTTEKIAAQAVTAAKIAAGTITTNEIAANAVTTDELQFNRVASDPSGEGKLWYRTDVDQLRFRGAGTEVGYIPRFPLTEFNTPPEQRLCNGSFEEDVDGDGWPDFWDKSSPNEPTRSTTYDKDGDYSMRFYATSAVTTNMYSKPFSVKGSTDYFRSVWVRYVSGEQLAFTIHWYATKNDADNIQNEISADTIYCGTTTGAFVQRTDTNTSPSTARWARIELYVWNATTHNYVDLVEVSEQRTLEPSQEVVAAASAGQTTSAYSLTTSFGDAISITVGSSDTENLFVFYNAQFVYTSGAFDPYTIDIYARVRHGSDYYPTSSGVLYRAWESYLDDAPKFFLSWFFTIPKNMNGETIYIQLKASALPSDGGGLTAFRQAVSVWGHEPHKHQ